MKRIGILSDTHGLLDKRIFEHFSNCDEIWHAGDIGSPAVLEQLMAFKPTRAVWGNIDGYDLRAMLPRDNRFELEGVSVWITHIGGYPGKYDAAVKPEIFLHPPKLFICGHSHILKIRYDKQLGLLHINPGAAGKYGFHLVQTIVRLELDKGSIDNLEVIELNPKSDKL